MTARWQRRPARLVWGIGLCTNMEDRLDALGGTLQIETSPGHGTTLRAAVPVRSVVMVN
jgi:signal transduction histidine kinase